jgi:hypothetical protein
MEHEHTHGDCGHDHGWAPWRYVVLMLPLLLFLMGMPWPSQAEPPDPDPWEEGEMKVDARDLLSAPYTEQSRKSWEGKLVRARAQFMPGRTSKEFQLIGYKMTCCAADAYPVILATVNARDPLPAGQYRPNQWVKVTGVMEFLPVPGRDEYRPIIKLRTMKDLRPTAPDSNPFIRS